MTRINAADAGGLQAALDALPDTGGTVVLPAGTYAITSTVEKRLAEGQHLFLVGEGRATVLVNEARDGSDLLRITGAVGEWWPDLKITIRDITFVGNHASGDALVVDHPNDALIDACFFIGHGGNAVYLKTRGTNVTCRDCWMRDCKTAVRAENIHHLTLHGNQTRSMEGGQTQAEQIFLDRNCREVRVVNNHLAYGHSEGLILDGTAHHVIVGNTIEGFATGILARHDRERDCRDITIGSNYFCHGISVLLEGQCNGFVVSDNIVRNAHVGFVVVRDAQGSGAHNINGNVVRQSVWRGEGSDDPVGSIVLGDSRGCNVVGNVFDAALATPAIKAGPGGGSHVISSINVVNMPGEQIIVVDAPACMVSGNLLNGKPC